MPPTPQADRPQYADGSPVPDSVDSSTQQWSRGVDPHTGAKGVEPAEPVPAVTSVSPTTAAVAGGGTKTVTGTNLGGTTAVTVGGTAATDVVVVSETELTFTAPPKAAGAHAVVLTNAAGAQTGSASLTYS